MATGQESRIRLGGATVVGVLVGVLDRLNRLSANMERVFESMDGGAGGSVPTGSGGPSKRNWLEILSGAGQPGGNVGWSQLLFNDQPSGSGRPWLERALGYGNPRIQGWGSMVAGESPGSPLVPSFGKLQAAQQQRAYKELGQPPATATTSQNLTSAVSWTGPATSDDNKALTPQQVDAWLAQTRPDSPLQGKGSYILQVANQYGISVPLMLGIFLKESELGVTAGPNKVLSGITDPQTDGGLGGARTFQGYQTWEQAIEATAKNLATPLYRGKSLQEQIGTWYVGPEEWKRAGINATDRAGNGTVGQYVNVVAGVYKTLGIAVTPTQTATPAPAGSYPVPGGTVGDLASIWGGGNGPVTQDFGVVSPGIDQSIYAYGQQMGVTGHTGLDIGLAHGTQLYAPVGGTIIKAGGSGFFVDETGQYDPRTSGEVRIRLDNGHEIILGHLSHVSVQVGQRVNAGALVGRSGTANGAHLHLEYRVPDKSTPIGWRIVDPRTYLRYSGPALPPGHSPNDGHRH